LSSFMVCDKKKKKTKNKPNPKIWNLQKEEKPGGFNRISVCNFCM